jgi:hypothetical protein
MNVNRGISSLGVCAVAAYLVSTGSPTAACVVIIFGLAIIWD